MTTYDSNPFGSLTAHADAVRVNGNGPQVHSNPFTSLRSKPPAAPPAPIPVNLKTSTPREWILASDEKPTIDASGEINPFGEPSTRAWLTQIETETGFWDSTPQLQLIAYEAANRDVSPWGVLAAVMEHRASHVSPSVVLVNRAGKRGPNLRSGMSLNGFVCLVAEPGGGKSDSIKLADELLPPWGTSMPDGTGQGMLKHLSVVGTLEHGEDGQKLAQPVEVVHYLRHAMMIHAPEIQTLNAEFVRSGSKTDSVLRSLWVGETVGMTNADTKRKLLVHPNTVRVCAVWGVQPENAAAILAQDKDGTPQRFVWAPVDEFRLPRPVRTTPPPGVEFPVPVFQGGLWGTSMPQYVELDDPDSFMPDPIWVEWSPQMHTDILAYRAILDAAKNRDPYADIDEEEERRLDGVRMRAHLILVTIKQAVKLAWIHGRANPSDGDWELAKIQMEVSQRELSGAWKVVSKAREREAHKRGTDRLNEHIGADAAAEDLAERTAEKVLEIIARNEQPVTDRMLKDGLTPKLRQHRRNAVKMLVADGKVAIVKGPRGGELLVPAVP